MRHTAGSVLLAAMVCSLAALGQDISGSISGTVLDPSGGAVPNAKITVTNTDRNQVIRTLTTGVDGTYAAPLLPIGTYTIKVEASGFRTATREKIAVNVNDQLVINLALEVGSVTEQVSVQEETTTVELGTVANSALIEGKQIRELALNTRNYEQLVALVPGVSPSNSDQLYIGTSLPSGLVAVLPFSVNGQRNSANNWTIDGADNVDRGGNLTLLNYPSVDALTEFKVLRSQYTADSGRAGGAQVNVVTKSGTSQFHGDAYEFVRNDAFAANSWLNNANRVNLGPDGKAVVPPLRYNDFGYTIGGPVIIPNHYNKDRNQTFFFFSQELNRVITYTTFTPSGVPTAAEKQGIFATPVCTALSGSTCTQTATQVNINPVAAEYLKDVFSQVPDGSAAHALFSPQRQVYNRTQELVRIDHTVNEKLAFWGRFLDDSIPSVEPGGLGGATAFPNIGVTHTNAPGRSVVVHATATIRPTLLNDVGYNYSYGAINSDPVGAMAAVNSPDVKVNLPFPTTKGILPSLTFTGGSAVGTGATYRESNQNHNIFDMLTWVKGRHTLRFGVSVNRYQKAENGNTFDSNQGSMTFTNTGVPAGTTNFMQSWANFLLGNVSSFSQTSLDLTADLRAWQTEAYAQDDFRVRKNLTLYLGVRYSRFGQPGDTKQMLTNFDASTYDPTKAPAINTANGNLLAAAAYPTNGFIISGRNSPYGGQISNNNNRNFAPRLGVAWDPFGNGKTSLRAGYGIYYDSEIFGMYETNIFVNPPFVQNISISNTRLDNLLASAPNVSLAVPAGLKATPLPDHTPYVQQWSFDVQRQIQNNLLLDVGYFGSKGTHLLGYIDINQAVPGTALAAGLHTGTGTVFTTADDPRINAVRPYLGYGAINAIETWFNSNYHSLQASVQKNFANGMISAAYTWSKALTDNPSDRSNAPQNSYNFHEGEYGPSQLDRRHVLTANYYYTLPIFKGAQGAAKVLLQGWEISGINEFGTGLPNTVSTSSVDPAGVGLLGASAASARPDQTCDPNVGAAHTVGQWFNTGCYAAVPQGAVRPGNSGRGTIRGPGFQKWDYALIKNFQFRERYSLQVRGEAFNLPNHPSPVGIGSFNNTNGQFGKITSFRDPRTIQIGAKLYF